VLDGASQKSDGSRGFLVGEHFDVSQAGRVVDRDVDGVPADAHASDSSCVGAGQALVACDAGDALACAAGDAAELLDVDVDQLAGTVTLVASGGLHAETAKPAHPDPLQDPRDGRDRDAQQLGELRRSEPQPPQRSEQLHELLVGAVVDPSRR
jgi:hypothetical protein